MDFSTLQSRVLARLNMSTADPVAANVDEYVNEAIHYLETAVPDGFPWMRRTLTLTTTAGTGSYTFATLGALATPTVGIAKILSARVLSGTTYNPLVLRTPDEINQLYVTSNNTGLPESYYVEAQTLYVYPSPDAAYSLPIRVLTTEIDLGGSTSTPAIPTHFHGAIVEASLLLMYETLQDTNRMSVAEQKVDRWVVRMKNFGAEYEANPKVRVRDWL